jgi:AcrR family transcriptional regulator
LEKNNFFEVDRLVCLWYISSMATKRTDIAPRERILATAADLFFKQGYRATGINEVIKKSGVAKATFYHHFPTKDDLCLAYLQELHSSQYEAISAFARDQETPKERFLAVIESVEPWLKENGLRGCPFLNMVAEVPDPSHLIRREGRQLYDNLRRLVRALANDLIQSDRQTYGELDAERLATDYLLILTGAIAMTEIYHEIWPARQGIEMVKRLIE